MYIYLLMISLLSLLVGCTPRSDDIIKPSKLFYIHDQNHILLNATTWTIFSYGEELYEDSKASNIDTRIQGSQVVVLAYLGDEASINSTEIFNHWGIGQNDMGILLILYFSMDDDTYIYQNMTFEIGQRMSNHLSAFKANELITTYFDDPNIFDFDYDMRLINLYHGILSYIYLNVYDYNAYNHTSYIDSYKAIQYDYIGNIPSYNETNFDTWFWVILTIIVGGGSLTSLIPLFIFSKGSTFKGDGGKSIGYWFKR